MTSCSQSMQRTRWLVASTTIVTESYWSYIRMIYKWTHNTSPEICTKSALFCLVWHLAMYESIAISFRVTSMNPCDNHTIVPMPMKQSWRIWLNTTYVGTMNRSYNNQAKNNNTVCILYGPYYTHRNDPDISSWLWKAYLLASMSTIFNVRTEDAAQLKVTNWYWVVNILALKCWKIFWVSLTHISLWL